MMNEAEIKKFALDHAPELAEKITSLCGKVITQGLIGVLEKCSEMQIRIRALEYELSSCKDDYFYLHTIVEDRDDLHAWLRMRRKTVSDVVAGELTPNA